LNIYKPSGHTELPEKGRETKAGRKRVTETRKSQNNKCYKYSKLHCRQKETESDRVKYKKDIEGKRMMETEIHALL
jgi:hypothetical protein